MATFEEGFVYPLILLLVGAGVTSLLIPLFTKKWEDRKKKLEIRVDITSKMAEAVAYQVANAVFAIERRKNKFDDDETETFYEDMRKWYVDISTIGSKLDSYFSEAGLSGRWRNFCISLETINIALRLYFLEARSEYENTNLKSYLAELRNYLSDDKKADWDRLTTQMIFDPNLWNAILNVLIDQGEKMLKHVSKLPIKIS
jgi:hypothetical protein